MMLRTSAGVVLGVAGFAAAAVGQTHVVKKPETVVRAVAVYEFTGEEGKATASRVVPVSVFINGGFEDGGVYLARPVPFSLDVGTVFELEKAGMAEGTLELAYARHLQGEVNSPGDEGWFAYGAFKPRPVEVAAVVAKSGVLPVIVASGGTGPKLNNKSDVPEAKAEARTPVDRSTAVGGGATVSAAGGNADSDSAKDDPDRPTLKKRTPAEQKATQKKNSSASVAAVGELNDDPDRPNLHRGKPVTRMDETDLPPLQGLPKDMHQMVAVSDAKTRAEHDFARPWESDAERVGMMATMRGLAMARVSNYGTAVITTKAATAAERKARAVPSIAAGEVGQLVGEELHGFLLSYGGAETFVYSAATAGTGVAAKHVLLVAQKDQQGALRVAFSSVTDEAHLDRTPWMRLVDAVDAEASNRASLLIEMRGATTRQFGLYRVIGARAEQVFVAGGVE